MSNRKRTKGRNYVYERAMVNVKDKDGNVIDRILKTFKKMIPTRQQLQNAAIMMGIVEKIQIQRSKYKNYENPSRKRRYKPLWNSKVQGTYVKAIHGELKFNQ